MGNFWWSMSIFINSLEVEKCYNFITCMANITGNIHDSVRYENGIVHQPFTNVIFLFRNILYHLDEKTSQFSILLEAWEHCKSLASNETLQEAVSEVLHSINSAQVYFKAGLDVFESVLVGKNWENSRHFKKFVYNSSSKSSNLTRFSDIEDFFPQWLFIPIYSYYITLYFLTDM